MALDTREKAREGSNNQIDFDDRKIFISTLRLFVTKIGH
jgi:hypothetical protein